MKIRFFLLILSLFMAGYWESKYQMGPHMQQETHMSIGQHIY
jgi:hypothetical protein